jgi:hypothetical protein
MDAKAIAHARAIRLIFDKAIEPVARDIALEVAGLGHLGPDDVDRWKEMRTAQITAHQSFALTIGAMWEREFQTHLLASAREIGGSAASDLATLIKRGRWEGLTEAFSRIHGFSLERFPMYRDLHTLHLICSAVRHGKGRALDTLRQTHSHLFLPEAIITSFWDYFFESVDPASVSRLDLSLEDLRHFRDAVASYWEAVNRICFPRQVDLDQEGT